ncbi:unnamed protein product [Eruca vesicaria subsp. sativa]|uniref:Uncharacterized protein n=1 Tax=Eruca vesicaria subsp. sativa TaxID=29727 RepID=A0ABC8K776_ERUVS|nr:unnamed protein product [Eruca vesicaria subsp. sativa]
METQMMLFCLRKPRQATNTLKLTILTREKMSFPHRWKEYADCSEGPIPQVVPKNKLNTQLTETPLEAYVSSTLYEVEAERVGVPVKRGLYEVCRRRMDQPSGFVSHTWKSWLKVVMPAFLYLRQFSKKFWN